MAWTQDDIAKLESAIASGVLSVSYAGPPARTVTYQSTDAMLRVLSIMKGKVGGKTSFRRVKWRKGFNAC
jgi:hypothetical protein